MNTPFNSGQASCLSPSFGKSVTGWKPVLLWLALLLASIVASAQNYSIDWYEVAGGGGTSTGDVYSVTGTIGQPDAGAMSGGNFTLQGGFWALPAAVQAEDAPMLTIVPAAPGQATISWSPATPGFVLQENPDLTATNWVNSPSGATNPIIVPATLPTKFYRVHKS
jgi:hypothetical protein